MLLNERLLLTVSEDSEIFLFLEMSDQVSLGEEMQISIENHIFQNLFWVIG